MYFAADNDIRYAIRDSGFVKVNIMTRSVDPFHSVYRVTTSTNEQVAEDLLSSTLSVIDALEL